MKKLIYIACLFVATLAIQSCCATANCPGVAQVETPQSNS
tara:strand:+ start:1176 stop:1295 length:120 start_codon:yes stop_codon:yes gene_type:complete